MVRLGWDICWINLGTILFINKSIRHNLADAFIFGAKKLFIVYKAIP